MDHTTARCCAIRSWLSTDAGGGNLLGVTKQDAVGGKVTDYYATAAGHQQFISAVRRTGRVDNVWLGAYGGRTARPCGPVRRGRRIWWKPRACGFPVRLCRPHPPDGGRGSPWPPRARRPPLVAEPRPHRPDRGIRRAHTAGFDDRLRQILRVTAEALQVDRVSLWRLDGSHQEIRCDCLFRREAIIATKPALPSHAPAASAHFDALETQRVIAADDAHRDPENALLSRRAISGLGGIGAMMDVPLRVWARTTLGAADRAEHVGGVRVWTLDEQNFALSVSNLITVALADEDLRAALARVAESEARARIIIVDTAHDAFIGIDGDGHIVDWKRTGGRDVWLDADRRARPQPRRHHHPGKPSPGPCRGHAALSRDGQRSDRERAPRADGITSVRARISGRAHDHVAVSRRGRVLLRRFPPRHFRPQQNTTSNFAPPRMLRRRAGIASIAGLASAGCMQPLLLPIALHVHAGAEFSVAHYRTSRHAGGDYDDVSAARSRIGSRWWWPMSSALRSASAAIG